MESFTHSALSRIKIGNRFVGEGEPTYFIAEIGNNHNGDYYLAKRTIEEAARAGADAVKFQKRFIDEVFTREMQSRPQTKDQVLGETYGEYRRALELNQDEFAGLKKIAEGVGLTFFAIYPGATAGKVGTAVLFGSLFGFYSIRNYIFL